MKSRAIGGFILGGLCGAIFAVGGWLVAGLTGEIVGIVIAMPLALALGVYLGSR